MESKEEMEKILKIIQKKRKREKQVPEKKKNKGVRKTKQKILNEYYNLKPVIKVENNIRLIEPYEFKYQLYIKRRWIGKKLIDVLDSEFQAFPKEYYSQAITDGKILINNNKTTNDYILKDNDFLTHLTIRNENPIIAKKLDIVFEDENYLVVDKPSSWPVHICGGYNFNTLQRILMDEYKYNDIKILHRLDKQTSGIVIFAKNKESADVFRSKLHTDEVQKIYLARVKGNFVPQDKKVICKKYIKALDKSRGIHTDVSDIEVEKYLKNKKKEESIKKNKKKENKKNKDKDFDNKNEDKDEDNKINDKGDKERKNKINDNNSKDEEGEDHKNKDNNINEGEQNKNNNNIINEKEDIINQNKEDINNEEYNEKNEPKYAETEFEFLFYDEKSNTSVVKCYPKTGRTHQIRIHLRSLGFPIANDPCYGGIIYNDLKEFDNQKLKEFQFNTENKDISVSELFCYKIWLHSFSYKFDKYEFKTKEPDWAKKEYNIEHKF